MVKSARLTRVCKLYQPDFGDPTEHSQVIQQSPLGGWIHQAAVNLLEPLPLPLRKNLKNAPLPVGQVVAHREWRGVAAGQEPDQNSAACSSHSGSG